MTQLAPTHKYLLYIHTLQTHTHTHQRFVARYGAENATVNPDMAEAEVTRQVAKLQELAVSTNASVADAARKALQAYSAQQRARAEEERAAAAEILAQEAALSGAANGGARKVFPLRQSVPVGEFAYLNPVPRIKLEGLDTIPDVRAGSWRGFAGFAVGPPVAGGAYMPLHRGGASSSAAWARFPT